MIKKYDYINTFCKWIRWEHKVLGLIDNQYYIPVNITTVNCLCDISNTNEMNDGY